MKRYLCMFLCFVVSAHAVEVKVDVAVPAKGRGLETLRFEAIKQARLQAADSLPTVIVGVERHLTQNEQSEYTQIIKGLDAGAIRLNILTEGFSSDQSEYHMSAMAVLDEKLSLQLINDIQEGLQAISSLRLLHEELGKKAGASLEKTASSAKNWTMELPADLSPVWFTKPSEDERRQAEGDFIQSLAVQYYTKFASQYLALSKVVVTGERTVTVNVPFDWYEGAIRPFIDKYNSKMEAHGRNYKIYPSYYFYKGRPCLVEYKPDSDGKKVVYKTHWLAPNEGSVESRGQPKPFSKDFTLRDLWDEKQYPQFRRNLLADPSSFKLKFCYKDYKFYDALLEVKSTMRGASK